MFILVDLSYITSDAKLHESVAIYALRVIDGFLKNKKADIALLVSECYFDYFNKRYSCLKKVKYPQNKGWYYSIPYVKGLCKMFAWRSFINTLNCDVVYIPFAWSGNSLKCRAKKIITIHDLRPMRSVNRAFTQTWWFKLLRLESLYKKGSRFFYENHVRTAECIIAISEYVKNDICLEWPNLHLKNKIFTIHNGVVLPEAQDCPGEISLNEKYILYVNTLNKYKNIETLVKAFHTISQDITQNLVLVGKDTTYWREEMLPLLNEYDLQKRVIHIKYCTNEVLKWLYVHADLFVTTSTREGFGYTPIEAAICECPVISTRCESLPEVTCNLLNYYDPPKSWKKLATVMFSLLKQKRDTRKLRSVSRYFKNRYDNSNQSIKIYNLIISVVS